MPERISVPVSIYSNILVTIDGEIFYENRTTKGLIEKWLINSNTSQFVMRFEEQCYGLFIDNNNTLYCSITEKDQVVKKSLNEFAMRIVTVAGTDEPESSEAQLHDPWGIFVDTNFDLYVADAGNNRIQRFKPGQKNGITVAGFGKPNSANLKYPTDIVLDADSNLFIADNDKHRIIRSNHTHHQCIIGCNDNDATTSGILNKIYSLRFGRHGDIFVVDECNRRIVKFILSNDSSGKNSNKKEL